MGIKISSECPFDVDDDEDFDTSFCIDRGEEFSGSLEEEDDDLEYRGACKANGDGSTVAPTGVPAPGSSAAPTASEPASTDAPVVAPEPTPDEPPAPVTEPSE